MAKRKKKEQVGPCYKLNPASASAGKCKPRPRAAITNPSKVRTVRPTEEDHAKWAAILGGMTFEVSE